MEIQLINPKNKKPLEYIEGGLTDREGNFFPLKNGAYRFIETEGYCSSFGFQWNKFQRLQIDKYSGVTMSRDRFFAVTKWDELNLDGENILEVGSGAGRFTQIVLDYTKANLYSVDYSEAVEANFRNNGPHQRLKLFQTNIYELPFLKASFDRVFCFGVLQHTPDVKKSIQCLIEMVKPGGELIVDFYQLKGFWTKVQAKYLLRPVLKKISNEKLLAYISANIDWLITLSKLFIKLRIDRLTNRFLPICDIKKTMPQGIDNNDLREWIILDTFDMFSAAYDQPQKIKEVKNWFVEMGMTQVFGGIVRYSDRYETAVVKGIK